MCLARVTAWGLLAGGWSHACSGNIMDSWGRGGGSHEDPQAGAWVEESGFCSFPERAVLMFLNVPLRARAGENANEPKKKQFTHAQSGCKFTTRSIRKIAATSAAKSAALLWFKEQAQAARTYSVLQVQMAWLLGWGREDLREKKISSGVYKSQGVPSALRGPVHPERTARISVGCCRLLA